MSAVSIRVIPASSAAWMVAIDWDSSGISLSLFDDIGMAPRPMAETVKDPRERVCMAQNLSRQADEPTPGQQLSDRPGPEVTKCWLADQRASLRTASIRCRRSSSRSEEHTSEL